MRLFAGVVEARESDAAVLLEEARQVSVAANRDHRDALGDEIPATAKRERLEGEAVARAFEENGRAQVHVCKCARDAAILRVWTALNL